MTMKPADGRKRMLGWLFVRSRPATLPLARMAPNEPLSTLLSGLASSPSGLPAAEAERRLAVQGPNDVTPIGRPPSWIRFLTRFTNPLILILLFAGMLSAAAGDAMSFAIVVVMILFSVVLDFVQEVRAESAVDALRRTIALQATVFRDGLKSSLPVEALVPGDVVELAAGDLVPADCRLIESRDLYVNQALLTGEPFPAEKQAIDLLETAETTGIAANAVYMGSSVLSGRARAVIVRTGRSTSFGQLAGSLAERAPPTSFETGLRQFGLLLLRLTLLLVLFVLLVNVLSHRPFLESLMFALALAVGLTPELLPMVTTVTLARGAVRLAQRRMIVKRLAAVHNIGAMDVLCTDKTGTLTEAKVRLVRTIDGAGIERDDVFELAYLNSLFETGIKSPLDEAMLEQTRLNVSCWRKLDEAPFDFERRRVSVLAAASGRRVLIVKGAPEEIISLSVAYTPEPGHTVPLTETVRSALVERCGNLEREGFRVLSVASREIAESRETIAPGDESQLVFAGFAVFLDPPKASAKAAIDGLVAAGVAVKILSGDSAEATRHVCAELGIPVAGVITGAELSRMSAEALAGSLPTTTAFCRVSPQQKLRVLIALQRKGHTVGFMGDGINDAAALHAADVGVSVETAADVARDAADVILLDKDLSVVREAVLEGRRSVVNVTKYILMGTSSNFGNMFSMAAAALFLPFLPMLPIQVLLNNLLYDGSETAIPFDNVDPEEIARPVKWDLRLIERFMLMIGPVSSAFDFLTFYVLLVVFGLGEASFQTGWFIESLTTQILVVFVIRTRRRFFASHPHALLAAVAISLVVLGAALPFTPVGEWFGFVPMPPKFFAFLFVASAAYLALVELAKNRFYRMAQLWAPPKRRHRRGRLR